MSTPSSTKCIDNNEEEQAQCDFSVDYLLVHEGCEKKGNLLQQARRKLSPQPFAENTQKDVHDDCDLSNLYLEKRPRRKSSLLLYPKDIPEIEDLVQKGMRGSWLFQKRRDSRCNPLDSQVPLEESSSTLESLLSDSFAIDEEAPGVIIMSSPPRLESSKHISKHVAIPILRRAEDECPVSCEDEEPGVSVSLHPKDEPVQKGMRLSLVLKKGQDSRCNPVDIQLLLEESSTTLESLVSGSFANEDEAPGVFIMSSPPRLGSSKCMSENIAAPILDQVDTEQLISCDDEVQSAL